MPLLLFPISPLFSLRAPDLKEEPDLGLSCMRSEPGKVPVSSKHISYLLVNTSKPRIAPVRFERGWWQKQAHFAKDYAEGCSVTLAEPYRQRTGALGKKKRAGLAGNVRGGNRCQPDI